MIQTPLKCQNFTENENLNKTCENKTRCILYYRHDCTKFIEKDNKINLGEFFKKHAKKEEELYNPPFYINKPYTGTFKRKEIKEAPQIVSFDISEYARQKVTEIYQQVDTLVLTYLPDKTLLKLKQKIDEEYNKRNFSGKE